MKKTATVHKYDPAVLAGTKYDVAAVAATLELAIDLVRADDLPQLKAAVNAHPQAYPKFTGIVVKAWAAGRDPVQAIAAYLSKKTGAV